MVGLGSTPAPEPHGGEGGADEFNPWPFMLLSIIILLSIVFDVCKETVESRVPEEFEPIVEAFLSELATLGFIGALAFLLTYNFAEACHPDAQDCTIMQRISDYYLGERMELQEIFEGLHFLLFFVSVLFILAVLVELRFSLRRGELWDEWEYHLKSLRIHNNSLSKGATSLIGSLHDLPEEEEEAGERDRLLLETPSSPWKRRAEEGVHVVRHELKKMMLQPKVRFWNRPGTMLAEYFKSHEQERAEYYRFRHRFIDDEEEVAETTMESDFDFGQYLKRSLAETFAEIIEIKVIDWIVLWLGFAVVFVLYAIEPSLVVYYFIAIDVSLFLLSLSLYAHLSHVRSELLPDVHDEVKALSMDQDDSVRPGQGLGEGELGMDSDLHTESVDSATSRDKGMPPKSSMSNTTGIRLTQPPYAFRKWRHEISNIAIVSKTASSWKKFLHHVFIFFHGRTFNKHQRLFHFGANGPPVLCHVSKQCLFGSVVLLAVVGANLWDILWEIHPSVPFLCLVPPILTLLMMPTTIHIFNLVTAIESMKQNRHILVVVKDQKAEKQRKAIRVLTSIQFFLDKTDQLSSLDRTSSMVSNVSNRDVSGSFQQISKDRHTRHMLEELRVLFDTYDVDKSGQIDQQELGDLLTTMGQPKAPEELDRLFNLMDADGSNGVDFKEFATVILHNRNCKHKLDHEEIARRMWMLFDKDNDGTISPEEMLETFRRLGANWDTDEIKEFLHAIDKDHNGTIDQEEFISYINECYGAQQQQQQAGHGQHGGHGGS
eukprot:CAMPEP_0169449542 /NCGR_PEP_ID=MMETSP1042-20121227/12667_1 /TAXON_ID=464988 /ORGANISM="Hemiselmis andersenii, Strain CCMP1180" /LENGTH=771 /DNA_ID=CAMNT_0009561289 /DNA_START=94 /DNA_END=2405 /DNA_ORIENTATION=+